MEAKESNGRGDPAAAAPLPARVAKRIIEERVTKAQLPDFRITLSRTAGRVNTTDPDQLDARVLSVRGKLWARLVYEKDRITFLMPKQPAKEYPLENQGNEAIAALLEYLGFHTVRLIGR